MCRLYIFFLNYMIVYASEKTSAKFHHQTRGGVGGGEEIKSSAFVLTNNCFNHLLLRN